MQDTLFNARIPITSSSLPTSMKIQIILNHNTLTLKLISTSNIFTFYICTISPGDFSITKREQGIKVDYHTFIKTLINYFQSLIDNEMVANCENMDETKIKFKFIENSSFRNVTRLELVFYKPDENEFKKYLAEMINKFESDNVRLMKEVKITKETMCNVENRLKDKINAVENDYCEMKKDYDVIYREKCILNDEVDDKRKALIGIEKKMLEYEKKIGNYEYNEEKYKIAEIKFEKERKSVNELNDKIERLESDIESKNKNIRKMKEEIKNLKNMENSLDEMKQARKEEHEKIKKEREDKNKKIKKLENNITDLKNELLKQDDLIVNLRQENKELTKKLENSQSVYNYFQKQKSGKADSNENEESSLFSSIHPETPPRK